MRKQAILDRFDRMEGWVGIPRLAAEFGVTRQYISLLLTAERGEAYRLKKHPTMGVRMNRMRVG